MPCRESFRVRVAVSSCLYSGELNSAAPLPKTVWSCYQTLPLTQYTMRAGNRTLRPQKKVFRVDIESVGMVSALTRTYTRFARLAVQTLGVLSLLCQIFGRSRNNFGLQLMCRTSIIGSTGAVVVVWWWACSTVDRQVIRSNLPRRGPYLSTFTFTVQLCLYDSACKRSKGAGHRVPVVGFLLISFIKYIIVRDICVYAHGMCGVGLGV